MMKRLVLLLLLVSASASAQVWPALVFSPNNLRQGQWEIWPATKGVSPVSGYGGVYFDFPTKGNATANYLLEDQTAPISGSLSAFIQILTSGSPVFDYGAGPDNACAYTAHARFYIERVDWDKQREYPPGDDWRWWSNPIALELKATIGDRLSVPLQPYLWSNVLGHFGNENIYHQAGFNETLTRMHRMGVSFGGGCFFGHGVSVRNGTARFVMSVFGVN